MKNLNIKFLLFALLCFTTSVFAQESYRLQYSFEKGKDYKYKMTNDGIVTQTVMGQEVKINISCCALICGISVNFISITALSYNILPRQKTIQLITAC